MLCTNEFSNIFLFPEHHDHSKVWLRRRKRNILPEFLIDYYKSGMPSKKIIRIFMCNVKCNKTPSSSFILVQSRGVNLFHGSISLCICSAMVYIRYSQQTICSLNNCHYVLGFIRQTTKGLSCSRILHHNSLLIPSTAAAAAVRCCCWLS